jgi:hypothetical protein
MLYDDVGCCRPKRLHDKINDNDQNIKLGSTHKRGIFIGIIILIFIGQHGSWNSKRI